MAAPKKETNVFTARIKPELLTALDRYAEDNTNGNRSAAANYFLELGLQQAGVLPKPLDANDIERIIEEKVKAAQEAIIAATDDSLAKQTAVQEKLTRALIKEEVTPQLVQTSQHILTEGQTQRSDENKEIQAAVSEALDAKLDEKLEPVIKQVQEATERKGFWARLFS